jgi:glycosyltransferase involved in cell wall biosynthesis
MKFTLFIPTRNEIDGMRVIMPRIRREWVDEILVVDGFSTDGTVEYCREHGYTVIQQTKPGLGAAYWECFDVAQGDVIIPFSPDNNSVPELIPELIAKMREGYDMVTVSRYLNGAKSEDDDTITAFGNWLFTTMVNVLYGGKYTDLLVMYRGFRKDLVKNLHLSRSEVAYFEQELAIRCLKNGMKVTEIPGDEPARIGGVRKMRIWFNGSVVLYAILKELFVPRFKDLPKDREPTH